MMTELQELFDKANLLRNHATFEEKTHLYRVREFCHSPCYHNNKLTTLFIMAERNNPFNSIFYF